MNVAAVTPTLEEMVRFESHATPGEQRTTNDDETREIRGGGRLTQH